ncbi:MAG: TonB-dependent receptor [Pyrinomonadaceae bacterium]
MRRMLSVLPRTFFCAIVVLLFTVAAQAQFKANLQGTVTDPAGGVVVGATVTLTSNETQRVQTATTNEEGFYRFSALPPGSYTVAAEQAGFSRALVENFVIAAEETQGLDLTLTTGQITETVTVTDTNSTALQTENANVSGVVTTAEVRNLPQVGRDPYELLRLTPGILGTGARSGGGASVGFPNSPGDDGNVAGPGGSNSSVFQSENQVPISANGQRISNNNFQIDGVSVNSLQFGGAAVVTPNQESVKEVRVTSSTYSAEQGRNSGAQVEVVSQNGTNDFHGSAFFKYNDPALNAFNKYGGINTPPQRVNNRFRQFGGSIGGPVYLPRFGEGGPAYFSGKNRLFFFFSTESLRENATNTFTDFVETPEYRQLIINSRPNSQLARIFNTPGIQPRIVSVIPGGAERFGNDPNRVRVVPGGLDLGSPTGTTGQYVSLGNPTGGGFDGIPDVQQVLFAVPRQTRGTQYNTRFDFNTQGGAQFTVSTFFTGRNDLSADAGSRGRPSSDIRNKPFNSAVTLAYIQTLGSSIVNEARFSFTRFASNQVESSSETNFGIPRIEVQDLPFDRIRFGAARAETTPAIFAQNTFEFRDTLRTVIGNHALSFGGQIRREQDNNDLSGASRPLYSFSGLFNLANETPIFEEIAADPRTGGPANAQRYFRTGDYAAFVQDDWKVRPSLTLNLGLRYEYFSPLTETRGRLTNFIRDPSIPAGGRVVITDKLYNGDRNNFAPRLGFAYSPNFGERFGGLFREGRAVLRGGFGISYNRIPNVLFSNTRGNPPFFARFAICCGTAPTDFGTPFVGGQILFGVGSSNSPFSFPVNPVLGQGIDPVTGSARGGSVEIYGAFDNTPNSYVYSYSFEGQYEMPFNLVGSLGYQGSVGHKLIRLVDQTLLFPINLDVFRAVFFPQPDTNSSYNALNARLTRRFSNGFQFEANYRFSKSIDNQSYEGPGSGTNQTNPGDIASERGPSDFDVKHFFTTSGTYETTFFRNSNRVLRAIFDGFQINGILTANSGFPFTPKFFADLRQPSGRPFGPIRPSAYLGGALNDSSDEAFIRPGGNFPGGGAQYFTLTPNAQPGVGRNSFRGPRFFSVDMSLAKKIAMPFLGLGEDANLELRANFFNAFNQLNLAPLRFFDSGTIITDPNFGLASRGLTGRVVELQARFRF